jgi:N-acetylmuramoyl-L-alanine amidase
MRSIKRWLIAGALAGALLLAGHSAEEKHLGVFTPQASYRIAVQDLDGHEYVVLLELLDPLGATTVRQDGSDIVLRFNSAESHLKENSPVARLGRDDTDLGAPVLVRDGRVLVPLRGVGDVVAHLLGGTSEFHRDSRRLFVNGAGVHYSAEFQKAAAAQLALKFSAPVNPSISTAHGELRMTFTRDAVMSATPKVSFDDTTITAAEYSESDGVAELLIRGNAPLLAAFSDGGRTITITPAPAATTTTLPPANPGAGVTPPAANVTPPAPPPGGETPTSPTGPVLPRGRNLVIIDAAHGGADPGAKLGDKLIEKEVTLALAYRLRAELEKRGITAILLREGDTTLSFEQRASSTDAARPALYIALHAGALGSGIHVYTALGMPPGANIGGAFLPWDTAQAVFMGNSRLLADAIVSVASKKQLPVLEMPAPVRPLNNIAAPAIAVELAPRGNIQDLANGNYQQQVAAALADGIVAYRNRPEAER